MFINHWRREVLTLPNLLSLLRLVMVGVFVRCYLDATEDSQYFIAGIILACSCLTDLLDGWIARTFNQVSCLGKILDPLADKITQLAMILLLSQRYPVLEPVLAMFLVKELFQLCAALLYLGKGKMLDGALIAGKLCTGVLFTTLTALVLLPRVPGAVVRGIAIADGIFLVISFLSYLLAYFRAQIQLRDA